MAEGSREGNARHRLSGSAGIPAMRAAIARETMAFSTSAAEPEKAEPSGPASPFVFLPFPAPGPGLKLPERSVIISAMKKRYLFPDNPACRAPLSKCLFRLSSADTESFTASVPKGSDIAASQTSPQPDVPKLRPAKATSIAKRSVSEFPAFEGPFTIAARERS